MGIEGMFLCIVYVVGRNIDTKGVSADGGIIASIKMNQTDTAQYCESKGRQLPGSLEYLDKNEISSLSDTGNITTVWTSLRKIPHDNWVPVIGNTSGIHLPKYTRARCLSLKDGALRGANCVAPLNGMICHMYDCSVCDNACLNYSDGCLVKYKESSTWFQAFTSCSDRGGNLWVAGDNWEDILRDLDTGTGEFWLGWSKEQWRFISFNESSVPRRFHFGPEEPYTGNCALLQIRSGFNWVVSPCDIKHNVICIKGYNHEIMLSTSSGYNEDTSESPLGGKGSMTDQALGLTTTNPYIYVAIVLGGLLLLAVGVVIGRCRQGNAWWQRVTPDLTYFHSPEVNMSTIRLSPEGQYLHHSSSYSNSQQTLRSYAGDIPVYRQSDSASFVVTNEAKEETDYASLDDLPPRVPSVASQVGRPIPDSQMDSYDMNFRPSLTLPRCSSEYHQSGSSDKTHIPIYAESFRRRERPPNLQLMYSKVEDREKCSPNELYEDMSQGNNS